MTPKHPLPRLLEVVKMPAHSITWLVSCFQYDGTFQLPLINSSLELSQKAKFQSDSHFSLSPSNLNLMACNQRTLKSTASFTFVLQLQTRVSYF